MSNLKKAVICCSAAVISWYVARWMTKNIDQFARREENDPISRVCGILAGIGLPDRIEKEPDREID